MRYLVFAGAIVPRVLVAVLVTVVDVMVRDKDPAEQEVLAVLFPAKGAEAS